VVAGRISPETRLIAHQTKTQGEDPRRGSISAQISGNSFQVNFCLGGFAGASGVFWTGHGSG